MIASLVLHLILILQTQVQTPEGGANWFQYGIAGILAFLMMLLIKYIIQRDKHDKEREDALAKQRSEMYREDNRVRDERWVNTMGAITDTLKSVDKNGEKFISATDKSIERFVTLIDKVMEQGNYNTQILTELKASIDKLSSSSKTDIELLKTRILDKLQKLGYYYELKKKDKPGE